MLGATHSCANPLTAKYGTPHGEAIALLLPSVVRWNTSMVGERYSELLRLAGQPMGNDPGETLARRLEELARAGKLPQQLRTIGVPHNDLAMLAEAAAQQWTGTFNPRTWSAAGALEVYQWAY
jgi:alcohol dehydrogenase